MNFHIHFSIQSARYVVFAEIDEENPALHRYVVERERIMQIIRKSLRSLRSPKFGKSSFQTLRLRIEVKD